MITTAIAPTATALDQVAHDVLHLATLYISEGHEPEARLTVDVYNSLCGMIQSRD